MSSLPKLRCANDVARQTAEPPYARDAKPALIHKLTLELQSLRAAMPSAGDLESIAYSLEITGGKGVISPDGTFFDASLVLRRAAELIRLAINEELESGQSLGTPTPGSPAGQPGWGGTVVGARKLTRRRNHARIHRTVEIILGGETAADPRHLTHIITNVERIAPLIGSTGLEEGIGIEDKEGGKTLLRFETLPELEAVTA